MSKSDNWPIHRVRRKGDPPIVTPADSPAIVLEIEPIDAENPDKGNEAIYFCPGCECHHALAIAPAKNEGGYSWTWNGSMTKPTFAPSVHRVGKCHCWVEDGRIRFLPDCSHPLAGTTADMQPAE